MKRLRTVQMVALAAAGLLAGLTSTASAQDHEKCYKIKDPAKIKGLVDLFTPEFGLEPGCKVSGAKYFCTPAFKTVLSATSGGAPIVPLPVFAAPAPGDRICYKIKCPVPPPPFPPDQNVTDQFGNRTLQKFKASYLCTPAVVGPDYCGNGVIDGSEACDGLALGACTAGCRTNCTCACETACCYVEQPPLAPAKPAPDAECFEYSGNPAQVAAFEASCTGAGGPAIGVPGSLFGPFLLNSAVSGACSLSPIFGLPCVSGPPTVGNLHILPSDSTCP